MEEKAFVFYRGGYRVRVKDNAIHFERKKVFSSEYTSLAGGDLNIKEIMDIDCNMSSLGVEGKIIVSKKNGGVERLAVVLTPDDRKQFEEMGKYLKDLITKNNGAVSIESKNSSGNEIRKKCQVCGNIFCYNTNDVRENERNIRASAVATITSVTSGFVGSRYDMYQQSRIADDSRNKVIDFNRCPKCGSRSIVDLNEGNDKTNMDSSIDEVKKYKALLDEGIISQDEFDKKKKELLNL